MKPKKKPEKNRFSALNYAYALENLKTLKACILAGEVQYYPDTVTLKLPTAIANFLINAIVNIQEGADPAASFGLVKPRGAPSKKERNCLFAIEMRCTKAPLMEVAKKFGIYSEEAAKSALRKGLDDALFYEDVLDFMGEEAAQALIDSLRKRAEARVKK